MNHPQLAQCYRCQTQYGRDGEPPVDWPPLADRERAVVGVICPDCHQAVLDEPHLGLTILSMVPVPDGCGTLSALLRRLSVQTQIVTPWCHAVCQLNGPTRGTERTNEGQ